MPGAVRKARLAGGAGPSRSGRVQERGSGSRSPSAADAAARPGVPSRSTRRGNAARRTPLGIRRAGRKSPVEPAVRVEGLVKRYRGLEAPAVDGIDLSVAAGEIFG